MLARLTYSSGALKRALQELAAERNITITFNETMYWMSVVSALNITPSLSYSPSWSNRSLIIVPNEPLQYGRWYRVRINSSIAMDSGFNLLDGDDDGNPGGDFILSFRTEEETPPEEVLDILPYVAGMLLAVVIILLLLYLLKGKTEPREEPEGDVEEEEPEEEPKEEPEEEDVDVEGELKSIEDILGIKD